MQAALRALRLNQHYPPAAAISPRIALHGNRWGSPQDWENLEADRKIATERLASLASLASNQGAQARIARFQAIAALPALTQLVTRPVEPAQSRLEVLIDTLSLTDPVVLTRWTLRGQFYQLPDDLSELLVGSAWDIWARISQVARLEELLCGRVMAAPQFPGALTACLTRISPDLERSIVDDPVEPCEIPEAPLKIAHQRKWAVPRTSENAVREWLSERGSKNLLYGY